VNYKKLFEEQLKYIKTFESYTKEELDAFEAFAEQLPNIDKKEFKETLYTLTTKEELEIYKRRLDSGNKSGLWSMKIESVADFDKQVYNESAVFDDLMKYKKALEDIKDFDNIQNLISIDTTYFWDAKYKLFLSYRRKLKKYIKAYFERIRIKYLRKKSSKFFLNYLLDFPLLANSAYVIDVVLYQKIESSYDNLCFDQNLYDDIPVPAFINDVIEYLNDDGIIDSVIDVHFNDKLIDDFIKIVVDVLMKWIKKDESYYNKLLEQKPDDYFYVMVLDELEKKIPNYLKRGNKTGLWDLKENKNFSRENIINNFIKDTYNKVNKDTIRKYESEISKCEDFDELLLLVSNNDRYGISDYYWGFAGDIEHKYITQLKTYICDWKEKHSHSYLFENLMTYLYKYPLLEYKIIMNKHHKIKDMFDKYKNGEKIRVVEYDIIDGTQYYSRIASMRDVADRIVDVLEDEGIINDIEMTYFDPLAREDFVDVTASVLLKWVKEDEDYYIKMLKFKAEWEDFYNDVLEKLETKIPTHLRRSNKAGLLDVKINESKDNDKFIKELFNKAGNEYQKYLGDYRVFINRCKDFDKMVDEFILDNSEYYWKVCNVMEDEYMSEFITYLESFNGHYGLMEYILKFPFMAMPEDVEKEINDYYIKYLKGDAGEVKDRAYIYRKLKLDDIYDFIINKFHTISNINIIVMDNIEPIIFYQFVSVAVNALMKWIEKDEGYYNKFLNKNLNKNSIFDNFYLEVLKELEKRLPDYLKRSSKAGLLDYSGFVKEFKIIN
jgi:hypothetical protein